MRLSSVGVLSLKQVPNLMPEGASRNGFSSIQEVERRLLEFHDHYQGLATALDWKFTPRPSLASLADLLTSSN